MTAVDRGELEREVRRLCEQGEVAAATVATLRGYGPEILGFLIAQHQGSGDADEVFSLWSERLFRGLAGFGWSSSLRTWAYTVAHNASLNFVRGRRARMQHELGGRSAELAALINVEHQIRTGTPAYLRTEAKSKLAAIRDALPADDRLLLVLRVDKRLEWKELARVMLGDDGEVGEEALSKESQRLRKRFQILKEKLLDAGKRAGILGGDEPV